MSETIQIRIAIAMAEDGTWKGARATDDVFDAMEAARSWLRENGAQPARCFWLVAEVPIPNVQPPEEIPAEIEEQS